MLHRSLVVPAVLAVALSLAACGGGGGSSVTIPPPPPGSPTITISPASLVFSGPGAASQTFTVSSSLGNVSTPTIDLLGCGPVAGLATASTSLPATYTVTPQGNGSCTVVMTIAHQSSSLGITVGGVSSPTLGPISPVTVFVGGTAGSVTVSASSGTITADATSCSGIAAVGGSGGGSPQTFTIAGVAAGTCTLIIADGASSTNVAITVNPSASGPNALTITPSTLTFSSPNASAQHATVNFTGNVGQVAFNQTDCDGTNGRPRIAFFTLTNVPPGQPATLPQDITVTPFGTAGTSGLSCSIVFTSSVGATQAVLTVFIQ